MSKNENTPLIPKVDLQSIFGKNEYHFNLRKEIKIENLSHTSGNISLTELMYLALITKIVNPKLIVEFGTFNGRSTSILAMNSLPDCRVITVDLPNTHRNKTKYELERKQNYEDVDELGFVGLKNKLFSDKVYRNKIEQLWMDSAQFPIEKYKEKVDLFFVDASHSYLNCKNDFRTALKCITPNGVIILHDYAGWPGVTEALNEEWYDHDIPLRWLSGTSFAILNSEL
jgi:predicted O-methyltransferase YrrM